MKRIACSVALTALIFLTIDLHAQQMSSLPYKTNYSNFGVGKMANAKKVLDLYKDFEKSDFVTHLGWFEDSLVVIFPDGTLISGKEKAIDAFKQNRETMSAATFMFEAVLPVRSIDHNEDWVCLWGTQNSTASTGNAPMVSDFQSIWRLSKSNKIDFIRIFEGKPVQQQ